VKQKVADNYQCDKNQQLAWDDSKQLVFCNLSKAVREAADAFIAFRRRYL
jgi:hypothetical protein